MTQDNTGWIILVSILVVIIIAAIVTAAFVANAYYHIQSKTCFGTFGVETNVDAVAINACGPNRSDPCIFAKGSLADCESECDALNCTAFTYNEATSTMKVVIPSNLFTSPDTNLFVRQ